MGKKSNDPRLAPSDNPEWDRWGAQCGFTSWAAAAAALDITTQAIIALRAKRDIPLRTRFAMAAILHGVKPYTLSTEAILAAPARLPLPAKMPEPLPVRVKGDKAHDRRLAHVRGWNAAIDAAQRMASA